MANATSPRISVIVPSYNHSPYIGNALDSVLAQTYDDWEVVVTDDGSQDNTTDQVQARAARDSRIRYSINEQNLGTYGNQNRALSLARGDWVAVLNSDDYWHPRKLELQAAKLDLNPPFIYCLGWPAHRDGTPDELYDVHADWPTDPVNDLLPWLVFENRILASGVLFRREGMQFEPTCRYSGDWVALLRKANEGPAVGVMERLTYWRQHDSNASLRSPKQVAEEIRVRRSIAATTWDRPMQVLRRGLAQNYLNLAALAYLTQSPKQGRRDALAALRMGANPKVALRRWLAGYLPASRRAATYGHLQIPPESQGFIHLVGPKTKTGA